MKRLVFISDMAFDANVSIIKELRRYYEVFFFTRLKQSLANYYGVDDIPEEIYCTVNLPRHILFDGFLDAEHTFLLKDHSIVNEHKKAYWNKIRQDMLLLKYIKKIYPNYVLTDNNKHFLTCLYYRKRITHLKHDPFAHSGEKTLTSVLSDLLLRFTASRFVVFNSKQYLPFVKRFHLSSQNVCCSFLSIYEYYHIFDNHIKNDSENNDSIKILFWGRISAYKGIEYLIKGFATFLANNQLTRVSLTIAGKGDFDFDIEKYTSKYPQIKVINRFINVEELVQMIHDASFVVCPYTDATQSGVVMTAFAYKKPILATNVGGLPEMLGEGKMGVIVEPKSSDAIYTGIKFLTNNPLKVKEYKQNITDVYYGHGEKSWFVAVRRIVDFLECNNKKNNENVNP